MSQLCSPQRIRSFFYDLCNQKQPLAGLTSRGTPAVRSSSCSPNSTPLLAPPELRPRWPLVLCPVPSSRPRSAPAPLVLCPGEPPELLPAHRRQQPPAARDPSPPLPSFLGSGRPLALEPSTRPRYAAPHARPPSRAARAGARRRSEARLPRPSSDRLCCSSGR